MSPRCIATPRAIAGLVLAAVSAVALVATGGCGGETTGRRVALATRAATALPADRTFVTPLGWTVTLTRGAVATGPLYYFDGPPAVIELAARSSRPSSGRSSGSWLRAALGWLAPVGTAHAHPGHYAPGRAIGQVLAPYSFDLLADAPTALPDGEGITGRLRSGTFSFAPPSAGPAVDALDGAAALVEGVAVRDGQTVHFRASAALAEIEANARDAQIVGSVFAETDVTGDGTVTVTVHPAYWFTLVDFAGLPPGTPEAPTALAPGTTPRIAFALGLAQVAAYSFELTPDTTNP